jgi:hypothetical protein
MEINGDIEQLSTVLNDELWRPEQLSAEQKMELGRLSAMAR